MGIISGAVHTSIVLDKIHHMIQTSKNLAFTMKTSRNRVQVTTQQAIVMRQEERCLEGKGTINGGLKNKQRLECKTLLFFYDLLK